MSPDRPVPGDLFVTGRGRLPVDEYELASKVTKKIVGESATTAI